MDIPPIVAAAKFDIPVDEILQLYKGTRTQLIALDQDELWVKLAEYLDLRIGLMMSARTELQRKLNIDRARRQAQRLRTLGQ